MEIIKTDNFIYSCFLFLKVFSKCQAVIMHSTGKTAIKKRAIVVHKQHKNEEIMAKTKKYFKLSFLLNEKSIIKGKYAKKIKDVYIETLVDCIEIFHKLNK